MSTKHSFGKVLLALFAATTPNAACEGSLRVTPSPDAAVEGGVGAVAQGASGGRCGTSPKQLVDLQALAAQTNAVGISAGTPLAVDATSLYFVMGYTLMAVPIGGGSLSTLGSLPDADSRLSQDIQPYVTSTNVVLHYLPANSDNEQIASVPIQGGTPTVLTTSSGRIVGFAVSGSNIYFVDDAGAQTISVGGGAVSVLSSQVASTATGLGVAGPQLVVTEQDGTVVGIPVDGGSPTTLATQQSSASFPQACGADVCWWTGAAPNAMVSDGPGAIARLGEDGGLTTIPGAPSFPWALAFDGVSFFEAVGCDVCPGTIVRVPLTGTPATMTSGGFVAVDDQCAYFTTIQEYPLTDGGSSEGIFSVSKASSSCCDASGGTCVYSAGACPLTVDSGAD